MNCEELRMAFWQSLDDGEALSAGAAEHARSCPHCRAYLEEAGELHAALPEAARMPEELSSVAGAVQERLRRVRTAPPPPSSALWAAALGTAAFWYGLWAWLGAEELLSWLPILQLPSLTGWLDALPSAAPPPAAAPLAALSAAALALWLSTHRTLIRQAAGRNHA